MPGHADTLMATFTLLRVFINSCRFHHQIYFVATSRKLYIICHVIHFMYYASVGAGRGEHTACRVLEMEA
ncbi:hypothetical protein Mapa_003337 [Marchantia paleacea]|nr:hypothetical protein Mapa_003337 [Marchantia paleacea]